jgi:short-subunit dehydrogenase
MKPRGGIIVNIASVAGKRTWKHLTAYSASKFGLMGFSNSLRREMKFYQYPIKIIVVCPPAIDTPFFANAGYKDYKKDHPGQTLLPPEIVAEEIYSAVMKGKREVVIGRRAKILDMLYRMSPRFTEWLEDFLKKK